MEKLGSTNAHGKVPFSTGSDFPSITTQAFTAILPASFAAIFLDVEKHYLHKSYTQFKHCSDQCLPWPTIFYAQTFDSWSVSERQQQLSFSEVLILPAC